MKNNLGETICQYRQLRKMTQDEFASRLGVTPQAVSKWERGNGMPDISLLEGICKVLKVNPNTLLGMEDSVVENGNPLVESEIKNNMFAEPLVLEFGKDAIPFIISGFETDYINRKRKELVQQTGILMPIIRIRDNMELKHNCYRILSYDKVLFEGTLSDEESSIFQNMVDNIISCCKENYASILNKQLVKIMIDNLKQQYPGIADGLIPERISYLSVERKLQEKLKNGENIRGIIHILEEMEKE